MTFVDYNTSSLSKTSLSAQGLPYKARLNDGRHVSIQGSLIHNICEHPAFQGTIERMEQYYLLQDSNPDTHMTPIGGQMAPISLLVPRSKKDLLRKRRSYQEVAGISFGMLGRTPDFMNAAIMTIGEHADILGEDKSASFEENFRRFRDRCVQHNLFVAHAAINPQIDRARSLHEIPKGYAGVRVVKTDARGIWVTGAKMIATLAPIADEILVFNMPGLSRSDADFAVAFSTPVATDGLTLFCRKSLRASDLTIADKPIANAFDEIDAYLVFDNVFVPWSQVYVHQSPEKSDAFYGRSFARHHTGHQGIVRGLAKAELATGVAIELARILGLMHREQVLERLGELTTYLEISRGLILLAEEDSTFSPLEVLSPSIHAIQAVRYNFPKMYERALILIRDLAAGSMLSVPEFAEFSGDKADILREALGSEKIGAEDRTKLLNLAWDLSGDGFGQRQLAYEYYHAGDPQRIAAAHFGNYPTEHLAADVSRALQ